MAGAVKAKGHSDHDMHVMHSGHGPHEGHGAGPEATPHDHHESMIAEFRRRFRVCLILTIPILAASPTFRQLFQTRSLIRFHGDSYFLAALSTIVYLYGGWPFFKGIHQELKSRAPGMMTLVALAITTAYVYSTAVVFGLPGMVFYWELATLVDIMLLGHWIEMRSVMGASNALEQIARLIPKTAHKMTGDNLVEDAPVEGLMPGDRVLIKPGEKIPADGSVVKGASSVNESMLTGESRPLPKELGAKVFGGSINGEGSLEVKVLKTGNESFVAQVIGLVREAQASKSRAQDLANKAALWLTIIALAAGLVTLVIWFVVLGRGFAFAIERTVTVMVITCPHALGLAVPLVVAVSTSIAARSGLLIRDRIAFEKMRRVQAIIFDKTGTLTEGRFGVTEVISFGGMSESELLAGAAAVESQSEHLIAQAIAAAVKEIPRASDFLALPGKGAQAKVKGKDVKVVSPGWLRENNIAIPPGKTEVLKAQGKTVVFVVIDGALSGSIALADVIRPESKKAVAALRQMGVSSIMLTGDNAAVAQSVAAELGIDRFFAELLPGQKIDKIKELQSRGMTVAMTGDGVNDAPALAQADVGIAIGAGTDVALASADIILVRSNPMDVVSLLELARRTYAKMAQNLAWATGYNALAIPLAAGALAKFGVLLDPAVGAILMAASTVIVAINARMLRISVRAAGGRGVIVRRPGLL